jgi:hypothetical protein
MTWGLDGQEQHQLGKAHVILILLCMVVGQAPSSQILVAPETATWKNRDEAFQAIAEEIWEVEIGLRRMKVC